MQSAQLESQRLARVLSEVLGFKTKIRLSQRFEPRVTVIVITMYISQPQRQKRGHYCQGGLHRLTS